MALSRRDAARHKLPAYGRAGVREAWLVSPTDRTVAAYRLEAGRYGRPAIQELKGRTVISALPGVWVDWDQLPATVAARP